MNEQQARRAKEEALANGDYVTAATAAIAQATAIAGRDFTGQQALVVMAEAQAYATLALNNTQFEMYTWQYTHGQS